MIAQAMRETFLQALAKAAEPAAAALERNGKVLALLPGLIIAALPALAASTADKNSAPIVPPAAAEQFVDASPPPLLLKPLSQEDAIDANRSIPFARDLNLPAQPFQFVGDAAARERALACLTEALYYEAGNESDAGLQAVAQVVLNRVRHPAFPASVCGVVFQGSTLKTGCQFTFTCDGSLLRAPDRRSWARAQGIAAAALSGAVFAPVGLSTHYHADYVLPYWATSLAKEAQIGTHIFYRWSLGSGGSEGFQQRYRGKEADPVALSAAALMAHGLWPPSADASDRSVVQFTTDPQLELIGVVGMLARGSSEDASDYETDVRSYFETAGDHSAVQLFRDAQSSDAAGEDLPTLSGALQEFAQQTDFARFFASHRRYYKRAAADAQRDAALAVATWEGYTAIPVQGRKITLALGPSDQPSTCIIARLAGPANAWLPWSPDGPAIGPADIFIHSGLSQRLLSEAPVASADRSSSRRSGAIEATVTEQVVRAVFARAAALSLGERAGDRAVDREAERGYALVPLFAKRLKIYERHRGDYPSLADFLPVLLHRVAADAKPAEADGGVASAVGECRSTVDEEPSPLTVRAS